MTTEQAITATGEQDYYSMPGLSNSGMKDLVVSPLRYWHLHINPNRPKAEPSAEMQFGSALHCLVLEPDQFGSRYGCCLDQVDVEGCLVTMDDLKGFLRDKGKVPKGKLKSEVTAQVLQCDPSAPVWDLLVEAHALENAGKVLFSKDDWARLYGARDSLLSEPRVVSLLKNGRPEVPYFATDTGFNVPLKAKMDWVWKDYTLDLKTFTQKRGKSIDKTVADAIFYEDYYRQAYLYTMLRRLKDGISPDFVIAFVESVEPFEVRLKVLRPKTGTEINLYWERGRIEVSECIRTYADFSDRFGDNPWRDARNIEPLQDEEMPQLAY